jgi:hypothetical protein
MSDMQAIEVHPQYLVDEEGQRHSVLLSLAEFEALMELVEDLNDAAALDKAVAASTGQRRNIRDVIADRKRDEAS